jgi:hypothetical protein
MIVQQDGPVIQRTDVLVVFKFLIGRNRARDDTAQVGSVACGLIHPAHVADRKAGDEAQSTRLTAIVENFE